MNSPLVADGYTHDDDDDDDGEEDEETDEMEVVRGGGKCGSSVKGNQQTRRVC
ncbi:hypothetical protein ZHAS_00012561 [Anopheles sinensis]|uniref:Uncharacterized protein n=1 Tax=Anopheles sinensis TaxID=74873 RepID=A0A084W365_ANOSI|nr:hypothetical protein ZHAS_00012561 [Anopheles sinensis]